MTRPALLLALLSSLSALAAPAPPPPSPEDPVAGTLAEPELRLFGDRLVLPLLRPSPEWRERLGWEPEVLADDALAISLSDLVVRTAGPEQFDKILDRLYGDGDHGPRLAEGLRALAEAPELDARVELLLNLLREQPDSDFLLKLVYQLRVDPIEQVLTLNELDPTLAGRGGYPEEGDAWEIHFFPWGPPVLQLGWDPDKVPDQWAMDRDEVVQRTQCFSVVPGVPTADEVYREAASAVDPFTAEITWEGIPPNGAIPPGGSQVLYGPDEFVLVGTGASNVSFPNRASRSGGMNRFKHTAHPLSPNRFYKYCIYSKRSGLEVARRRVQLTMPDAPPPALALTATVQGPRAVQLSWTPPIDGGLYLSSYELFRDGTRIAELRPSWTGVPTSYNDDPRGVRGPHTYQLVAHWQWTPIPATASAAIVLDRLVGLADTHNHQFANLGFGGGMLHGSPAGPLSSLTACTIHGELEDNPLFSSHDLVQAGVSMGRYGPSHLRAGFPEFSDWPRYDDYTHQQVHKDWLKRAWQGGLRLMVMLAVNSAPLCEAQRLAGIPTAPGRTCQDMENVLAQIAGARQLEAEIAGEGGWYKIVYTAAEARDAILDGKLAVVLGLEVDQLFDCRAGNAACSDPTFIATEVAKLRAAGIRHVFPLHLTDNAFGGAAVYNDFFNVSNRWINGSFFAVTDCAALPNPTQPPVTFQLSSTVQFVSDLGAILLGQGTGVAVPYPTTFGHCNATGLTPAGDTLVSELMRRKLIIDVDHMSDQAIQRTLSAAERTRYPLIAGHTGFNAMSTSPVTSHEAYLDEPVVDRLRALGGMVSVNIRQGAVGEIAEFPAANGQTPIPHDCSESATAFAQAYRYATSRMQGVPVGIGTDFNGLNGLPPPRFGPAACKGEDPPSAGAMVSYPFTDRRGVSFDRQVAGSRTFDINFQGVAQVGMLPDFIQELRTVGLSDPELKPLYESADRYLEMWEAIDARP